MTNAEASRLIRRAVTDGVLYALLFLVVGAWISVPIINWWTPYDDTDLNGERSGMEILTDCRTGLQYLSTREGGLTPRLDTDATQIRKECK